MDMVTQEIAEGVTCIRLTGRLDAMGADKIGIRFTAASATGHHHTVVDLSGVSFVASMGLRLLISSARAINAKGGKLVLFGAQELVREVLEQSAIDQIIPLTDSEAQAMALLAS